MWGRFIAWWRPVFAELRRHVGEFFFLFWSLAIVNGVLFGNFGNPALYTKDDIYAFDEDYQQDLFADLEQRVSEKLDVSAKQILNDYMNRYSNIGQHFKCVDSVFCPIFDNQDNKRRFIQNYLLKDVVYPVTRCVDRFRDLYGNVAGDIYPDSTACVGIYIPRMKVVELSDRVSEASLASRLDALSQQLSKFQEQIIKSPEERLFSEVHADFVALWSEYDSVVGRCNADASGDPICEAVHAKPEDLGRMRSKLSDLYASGLSVRGDDIVSLAKTVSRILISAFAELVIVILANIVTFTHKKHRREVAEQPM